MKLSELREQVEGLEGDDWTVDRSLMILLDGWRYGADSGILVKGMAHKKNIPSHMTRYTASIDDALALVERVLPGTMRAVGTMEDGPFARLVPAWPSGHYGMSQVAYAKSEPLSVIVALLRALESQEEKAA